jgi:hypothetical protein
MSFLSDLWSKIKRALSKLWKKLKPWLAVIILVVAICLPVLAPFMLAIQWPAYLGWMATLVSAAAASPIYFAVAGIALAVMVDDEAVSEEVNSTLEVIGDAAVAAANTVGSAAGSGLSGFLSQAGPLVIGGLAFYLWRSSSAAGSAITGSATSERTTLLAADGSTEEGSSIEEDGSNIIEGEVIIDV